MRTVVPLLTLLLAMLAGCATYNEAPVDDLSIAGEPAAIVPPRHDEHVVAAGDTLYGVAFRHGLDFRQLADWNSVPAPYTIHPGQRLRLVPPPATRTVDARPAATFAAPDRDQAAGTQPLRDPPAPVAMQPLDPPAAPRPAPAAPRADTGPVSAAARGDSRPPAPSPAAPPVRQPAPVPPRVASPEAAPASPVMVATGPSQKVAGIAWRWPANGRLINRYTAGDPARQGIDIQGQAGQPVVASADGDVVYSGNGLIGYGELVIVKHSNEFLSAYGYNRKRLVAEGDRVKAGQQIAEMGRSAAALDLLHFEIRRAGKTVDPLAFLPRR